ncbi:MAG: prolyl oligopeptidase family serine peptidase, partial [Desulfuromonadales bacterium]|nr:prolyl oligopeptidase family serine peptidase [Desulfuromonadales bacterium]
VPLLTACAPLLPREADPPAGTYRLATDLRYQLSRRDFLLHVPPDYRPGLPLVVVLHGAFSTGAQTEQETGFSRLADAANFVVAYPEGIGLFGYLQHWNAGHCCGRAAAEGVGDVDFIAEVIDQVADRLTIDRQRVYLVGMSNGGMLAYRFAAERSERLAAVAVVAGAMGSASGAQPSWQLPQPGGPLPLLIVHGMADEAIPWAGGLSPKKKSGRGFVPGATAAEFWRRHNHCAETPAVMEAIPGSLQRLSWEGCQGGSVVEVDLLQGWGHRWPGRHFIDRLPPGDPLHEYDGTRRIWDFFNHF